MSRGKRPPWTGRRLAPEPPPGDTGAGIFLAAEAATGHVAALGRELGGGAPFAVPVPAGVARHVALLGVTGSGKTTTAHRIAADCLRAGMAIVIVDAKGGSLRRIARQLAAAGAGVPYQELLPGDAASLRYNPCAVGTPAQVADKLVSTFTFGETAQVYQQISQEVIVLVVEALTALGEPVTLRAIRDRLDPRALKGLGPQLRIAVPDLANDLQRVVGGPLVERALEGMRPRLGILLRGSFGPLFELGEGAEELDLGAALARPAVTYISLPAMASEADVSLMARVLIQDLKLAAHHRLHDDAVAPALLVLDEFAALDEPRQIEDLLRQAREARVATVISTQNLPETPALRSGVLGMGLLICHQVVTADAQEVAALMGTRTSSAITSQLDFETGGVGKGSLREVEEYVIHPNRLRSLAPGEAAVLAAGPPRRIGGVQMQPVM